MAGLYYARSFMRELGHKNQREWAVHVVSFAHAVLISSLAFPMLLDPVLAADPLFAHAPYPEFVIAIACGYFLWDMGICLYRLQSNGLGFLVHGVSCFFVFLLAFKPFVMFYGGPFLMYELSTPFLNLIWFCDKSGRSGSRLQLFSGISLILVFFFSRIVGGLYYGTHFYVTIWHRWSEINPALASVYCVAYTVLSVLNFYWFYRILKQAQRRLSSTKSKEASASDTSTSAPKSKTAKVKKIE
ncbi:MAG: hypothetical protein SGCHY_002543 [Lobulomycetales sp.]